MKHNLTFWQALWRRPAMAPADAAGGASADAGGAPPAGDDAGAGAAPDPDAPPAGNTGTPAETRWWEDADRFDDKVQTMLRAKGLTVEDPRDAVAGIATLYRNAERQLSRGTDRLMDRPDADQPLTDWMRANGDVFGLPEAPDGYEVARPEGWPEGAEWDANLEARARTLAHETGMSQAQLQGVVDLYAGAMGGMVSQAESQSAEAQAALYRDLTRDWGQETDSRIARAQQAAQSVAAQAGLDDAAIQAMAEVLQPKIGDANVLRLFDAIGEGLAEDRLPSVSGGGGAGASTPAAARAELEAMMAPGSDFQKAIKLKRDGQPSDYDSLQKRYLRLTELAAG